MFLNAFFSTGRVIFIVFFVIVFSILLYFSYKKDTKNHERHYKKTGKKVAIYGLIVIFIFVILRVVIGNDGKVLAFFKNLFN